ncbi:MAG: hypothetical protein K9J37_10810 [Saprospiraceae bacterium]|nr:hypothetical protein [Saprospiraceae bacterium]MCF8250396.1 hypothetical protein [Saprospiraceae bacterium]MCF8281534.1 hypothetical protein [Bacteroidales bacterium]MCF8312229.1 hypothetical protein [Saprospiraceae bacterium]MCF8440570.1 hypothetical protein [Saprospiraceae bacterium]
MKNPSFSSYSLLGLAALSLFCYVYLHKVAYNVTGHCPSSNTVVISDAQDPETSKILLPDVALMKRFLNITKIILTKD